MPDRARVLAFVERVVSGDHVGAIRDFYHDDATMQEPGQPLRAGRNGLMAHETAVLARGPVQTHPAGEVLVDGDDVAIRRTFDMTAPDGIKRRLEEVSLQRWRGDRIQSERFFYDRGLAREPLTAPEGHEDSRTRCMAPRARSRITHR